MITQEPWHREAFGEKDITSLVRAAGRGHERSLQELVKAVIRGGESAARQVVQVMNSDPWDPDQVYGLAQLLFPHVEDHPEDMGPFWLYGVIHMNAFFAMPGTILWKFEALRRVYSKETGREITNLSTHGEVGRWNINPYMGQFDNPVWSDISVEGDQVFLKGSEQAPWWNVYELTCMEPKVTEQALKNAVRFQTEDPPDLRMQREPTDPRDEE